MSEGSKVKKQIVVSPMFNPYQTVPRDNSVAQYEYKPFYVVGNNGSDMTRYRNNTIKLQTKGTDTPYDLANGYLDFTFKIGQTLKTAADADAITIEAGVNDTFYVNDAAASALPATALVPATIAAGSYTFALFKTAFETAITTAGHTLALYVLTEALDIITLTVTAPARCVLSAALCATLGIVGGGSKRVVVDGAPIQGAIPFSYAMMHDNAMALFRKASLYFNNIAVHIIDYPVLSNTLMHILNDSQDKIDKRTDEWFYSSDDPYLLTLKKISTKYARTSAEKLVRCRIPLKDIFPFLQTYEGVVSSVDIRVELERNDSNYNEIVSFVNCTPGSPGNAPISIRELTMWIPEVLGVTDVEAVMLDDIIKGKKATVVYDQPQVYRMLNQPVNEVTWIVDQLSEIPKLVYVFLQPAAALDGGIGMNPSAYSFYRVDETLITPAISTLHQTSYPRINVIRAECRVNNKDKFPLYPYELDFEQGTRTKAQEAIRAYYDIYRTVLKNQEFDNGGLLSLENFISTYPIISFDMSRSESVLRNENGTYSIEVFLQFSEAIATQFYTHAVVVYEDKITIRSNSRNLEWKKYN